MVSHTEVMGESEFPQMHNTVSRHLYLKNNGYQIQVAVLTTINLKSDVSKVWLKPLFAYSY